MIHLYCSIPHDKKPQAFSLFFSYCKLKTGGGEGLGTRLNSHFCLLQFRLLGTNLSFLPYQRFVQNTQHCDLWAILLVLYVISSLKCKPRWYTGLPRRLARGPMGYFLSKIKIHSFMLHQEASDDLCNDVTNVTKVKRIVDGNPDTWLPFWVAKMMAVNRA